MIAFDLQEALSFEGETGPYVQYAAVRARNILRKLEETRRDAARFRRRTRRRRHGPPAAVRGLLADAAGRLESRFRRRERASTAGEPAHVAKYAFQLAQAFNNFYQQYPIIHEENREKKVFLLWMTDFFRRQLERTAGHPGHPHSRLHVGPALCRRWRQAAALLLCAFSRRAARTWLLLDAFLGRLLGSFLA